ncbi:hypothetical protein H311_00932 [Anncaliia algerae PRA109]|nr:hypothetical protein H311_00932 [Anncaliia algerae PRA109]
MNLKADELETMIIKMERTEFILFLMQNGFLKKEIVCCKCNQNMKLVNYNQNKDKKAWRCYTSNCSGYKTYKSIRLGSFFQNFTCDLLFILRVIIKYVTKTQQFAIFEYFGSKKSTIQKIIKEFRSFIPETDFSLNKLGGPGVVVQIDETMLNFKSKSHRGRSPNNRTDALCIVECSNGIRKAFATCINDKKASTIIPIITRQVAANSKIWTDEHRSYRSLFELGFNHGSVCHKYEFINSLNGVNTQAVESFNNCIKLAIKNQKGVLTNLRSDFLRVFLFFFNNKENILEKSFDLIKIK